MKITLIYPRLGKSVGAPPLGIAYIAAVLRENGYDVKIIDTSFGMTSETLKNKILKYRPDVVGISFMTPMFADAIKVAKLIKKYVNCPIVAGGPHPTILPEETLANNVIDYVLEGEGEISIIDLVQCIGTNGDVESVAGLWYKKDGEIRSTGIKKYVNDLDSLPFPARDLLPLEYSQSGREISILASRGCPFNCSFCQPTLRKLFGQKIRYRSPKNVVDEIEYMQDKMGIHRFNFEDDTFTVNKKWVKDLCSEIIRRGMYITWSCNSRVNTIDTNILLEMKKAGCRKVLFGVESGSQKILDFLNKDISIDDIKKAFKLCKQVGILTHAFFMIGSPGETIYTINETRNLIRDIKPDEIYISITTPLPMTKLYEYAIQNNMLVAKSWRDFDYNKKYTLKLESLTNNQIELARRMIMREFLVRKLINPIFFIRKLVEFILDYRSLAYLFNEVKSYLQNKRKRARATVIDSLLSILE